jgi:hypothetical protein
MGIEAPGLLRQRTAALPIAGIGRQEAQVGDGESVHRVECDGPFRCAPESLESGGGGPLAEVA